MSGKEWISHCIDGSESLDGSGVKILRLLEPQGNPEIIECDGVNYVPERTCKVIDAMREKGLSDNELAKCVGVERKRIFAYRHGCMPKVDTAIRIARTLEVDIEYLWDVKPNSVYRQERLSL